MTTPIVDLKCPVCGHLVGQEEHERVIANFHRCVKEKTTEEIEQLMCERDMKDQELQDKEKQLQDKEKQLQDMQEHYERNAENRAKQIAASKIGDMERKHTEEIREKDWQREEDRAGYGLQIRRQQERIEEQEKQLKEQKKALENESSEHRGTRGETVLFDDLHNAFRDDELIPKKVGVEMADVIQTVVEHEDKIVPPIVWDRKTADKVGPKDILKAKKYKTIHNTDYSIIVTENGITPKDSNNRMFGEREGIYLVHPTAVVDMARIFRSIIIDKAKQTSSNKDRTSKEAKMYEYLKSSEYARMVEGERNVILGLDDLDRRDKDRHNETWNNRKKFMDELRKIGEQKQQKINDIMSGEAKDLTDA
jgi:Uncharacterized protein conserved in bacteria (DUF2130)